MEHYISYDAIAIGSGSEDSVTDFLEKTYKEDLSLDEAATLAAAGIHIYQVKIKMDTSQIRMAHIKTENGLYELSE